ncbi:MAG TPA: transcriptional regulator [Methylomirabilota bacterium]|nr:transcriptional regulator [Methylomirabilota bacterium]
MLYHFGECTLDDQLYDLRRAGAPVEIEPKVFDVLVYLLHHRDRLVSKDELLDQLWPGQVVSETALMRCIVAARKAVGDDGGKQQIIKTQHDRGYRFVAPPITPLPFNLEASVQSLELQGQGLASSVQSLESEEQRQTVTDQALDPRLGNAKLSDPKRQTLDIVAPPRQRSWSNRSFVLGGLALLLGLIIAVQ